MLHLPKHQFTKPFRSIATAFMDKVLVCQAYSVLKGVIVRNKILWELIENSSGFHNIFGKNELEVVKLNGLYLPLWANTLRGTGRVSTGRSKRRGAGRPWGQPWAGRWRWPKCRRFRPQGQPRTKQPFKIALKIMYQ